MHIRFQILVFVFILFFITACSHSAPVQKAIILEELPIVGLNDVDKVSVAVGQQMVYGYDLYPSVGNDADYTISPKSVVGFVEQDEYFPETEPGFTGGDDGHGAFYFVALKSGRSTITIRHLFRGDVEAVNKILIDVK